MEFMRVSSPFNCPFCERQSATYLSKFPGPGPSPLWKNSIVRWCEECGSGSIVEADRLIRHYYSDAYAADRKDRSIPISEYFGESSRPVIIRQRSRVACHIGLLREHGANFGRVLDFGSGPGYFLYASGAEEKFSVELDQNSRKYLDHIGAKVVDLSGDDLPNESLDVVISAHSMEHLEPYALKPTIDALVRKLRRGGLILVEVPGTAYTYITGPEENEPHSLFFSNKGLRECLVRPDIEIVYAKSQAEKIWPTIDCPVWFPDENDPFESSRIRCPLIIARKR